METNKKTGRYGRIFTQLEELVRKTNDKNARMATIAAVLHHKMDYFHQKNLYKDIILNFVMI